MSSASEENDILSDTECREPIDLPIKRRLRNHHNPVNDVCDQCTHRRWAHDRIGDACKALDCPCYAFATKENKSTDVSSPPTTIKRPRPGFFYVRNWKDDATCWCGHSGLLHLDNGTCGGLCREGTDSCNCIYFRTSVIKKRVSYVGACREIVHG